MNVTISAPSIAMESSIQGDGFQVMAMFSIAILTGALLSLFGLYQLQSIIKGWSDPLSLAKKVACFAVGIAASLTIANAAWPPTPFASEDLFSPIYFRVLVSGIMIGLSPLVGMVTLAAARMKAMRS